MKVKKGQRLHVNDAHKGKFDAVAIRDFDTEVEEFYPVTVAEDNPIVRGMANNWYPGEAIPCRNSLCTITIAGEGSDAR